MNINTHAHTHKHKHTHTQHTHTHTHTYINTHTHTHIFLVFALGPKMSRAAPDDTNFANSVFEIATGSLCNLAFSF